MTVRACPHCKTEIPAPEAAAHSNDIECPKCRKRLEVSSGSRTIASICGLIAAAIAWRIASGSTSDLGGVLPTLYAFLAFGVVSPLALMLSANLRNATAAPTPEPAHGSGSGGHGGASHGQGQH